MIESALSNGCWVSWKLVEPELLERWLKHPEGYVTIDYYSGFTDLFYSRLEDALNTRPSR